MTSSLHSFAQTELPATPTVTGKTFNTQMVPIGAIKRNPIVVPFDKKTIRNLRGTPIVSTSGNILSADYSPLYTTFGVVASKKKIKSETNNHINRDLEAFFNTVQPSELRIQNAQESDKTLYQLGKEYGKPSAIAYTPDALYFIVATDKGIYVFDAYTYEVKKTIPNTKSPFSMKVSENGSYLATLSGNGIEIINLEDNTPLKNWDFGTVKVNDFFFSDDNTLFVMLKTDGTADIYNTRNFTLNRTLNNLGQAISGDMSPDGKYLAVATSPTTVSIFNLTNAADNQHFEIPNGLLNDVSFITTVDGTTKLACTVGNGIFVMNMNFIKPYYSKLLTDEVNTRMGEWEKMRPDETMEAYNLRVNDKSREEQLRLFEEEISTELAGDLMQIEDITLGSYNESSNELTIQFTDMPPIELPVPKDEAATFTSPDDLVFTDVRYGLTDNDKFEIVYANIHNTKTNKDYVYQNKNHKPIAMLGATDHKLSYEVIEQQHMEEMKLTKLAEEVVTEAKKDKVISDHTKIDVSSQAIPTYSAAGNRIINYEVNFTYEVEPEFSMKEDFGPGKYQIDQSGAAKSMMSIIKNSFSKDLAQYLKDGKKLKITISGSADATPVVRAIPYDGVFGEYTNYPARCNGELKPLSITKASGITDNPELAFIRAQAVRNYMENNLPALKDMDTSYDYIINVSEEKGSANRRISVKFTFIDAIKQ